MDFVAPAFLTAGVLAALPVVFHLLARRPARVVPFGPVELVRRAEARVRRRLRVRDAALLAARVLAIATVVLAVARPYVRVRSLGAPGFAGAEALVLVLDDSMSLRAEDDGPFRRGRRAALATVESLGAGDAAAVVFAGRSPRARPARPTFDLDRVRREIEDARPSDRGTDIPGALALASRMLRATSLPTRRVVVVTDLQKTGWPAGKSPLADEVSLEVVDVGEPIDDLAVVGVDVEPAPQLGTGFSRITATVRNSSPRPARAVPVTLSIDGETLATATVDVGANGIAKKTFHHRQDESGGRARAGEVSIGPDALPRDDRRAFLLARPRGARILLVDGDPRPSTREDETFYLVRALSAGASDVVALVADPSGVVGRRLGDYDAVFLCNVSTLPPSVTGALEAYVDAGGGLLFAGGDRVRPSTWNRAFGALLPVRLHGVRSDPDGATLAAPEGHHEVLQPFASGAHGLEGARFTRHLTVEPDPDLDRASTILRFESGEPLLVERAVGAGRVLWFASTLDADWTDLPLRTGYLPLVRQTVRHLSRRGAGGRATSRRVGDVVSLPLPAGTSRVVVERPDGERRTLTPSGVAASFGATDLPGVYRVRTEGRVGGLREDPSLAFAVTIDPAESDLRRWSHPPVSTATARTRTSGVERRFALWPPLLVALLALVALEAALRNWRVR